MWMNNLQSKPRNKQHFNTSRRKACIFLFFFDTLQDIKWCYQAIPDAQFGKFCSDRHDLSKSSEMKETSYLEDHPQLESD